MITHWWSDAVLENYLKQCPVPIQSWDELCESSVNRFDNLVFSESCFSHLKGIPFAKSSSDRVLSLLGILNRLSSSVSEAGTRRAKGHEIIRKHFRGDRA